MSGSVAQTERRRIPGKPFAIAFGTFLIVATCLVYYFARKAELQRQATLQRMEAEAGQAP